MDNLFYFLIYFLSCFFSFVFFAILFLGNEILTGSWRPDNQLEIWDFGTGKRIAGWTDDIIVPSVHHYSNSLLFANLSVIVSHSLPHMHIHTAQRHTHSLSPLPLTLHSFPHTLSLSRSLSHPQVLTGTHHNSPMSVNLPVCSMLLNFQKKGTDGTS